MEYDWRTFMKYSFGPIDSIRLHSCCNKSNRARSNQLENEFCLPFTFYRYSCCYTYGCVWYCNEYKKVTNVYFPRFAIL